MERNEGILEGGKQEQIIEIIIKKVKKGKELSTIASEIEEEEQDKVTI